MMAGLTDTLWDIEKLYDEVMQHQADKVKAERYAKLRSL